MCDRNDARRRGRQSLSALRPNYVNSLRRFGYHDDDFADGGSDRLVDALIVSGSAGQISDRVRDLLDRGADHVLLHPLADDLDGLVGQLELLAPAVVEPSGLVDDGVVSH